MLALTLMLAPTRMLVLILMLIILQTRQQNSRQSMQREQTTIPFIEQFKQQMLKAWQPVPSLTKTITMFFILSVIFLGLGIPMMILSRNISEYTVRYDQQCQIGTVCNINMQIKQPMLGPVFVYYHLNNYYQNHRLYANSISLSQLIGEDISTQDAEDDCAPIVRNKDLHTTQSIDGATLDPQAIANPCGVVAFTLFNDTFSLKLDGKQIEISDSGIAWPSDVSRFKNADSSKMWTNVESQRFMNWVRIAAMPSFRKLWGRIQTQLDSGNYTLTIDNNYNVSGFHGQKYLVVSQSNFFGSKNDFLAITYLVVGSLCLVTALGFMIKKVLKNQSSNQTA